MKIFFKVKQEENNAYFTFLKWLKLVEFNFKLTYCNRLSDFITAILDIYLDGYNIIK